MQNNRRKLITKPQWDKAAEDYELGHKNGAQIARELGVSPAAVSREFKRRGCIKGCRVAETLVELEKELNEKARHRAFMRTAREKAAQERSAVLDRLIAELMQSVIAASMAGDLTLANPTITEVSKALGVKPAR